MVTFQVWCKAEGQEDFFLLLTVERILSTIDVTTLLSLVTSNFLDKNGGIVEIRNTSGGVIARVSRVFR